jgi:hypothetical protein
MFDKRGYAQTKEELRWARLQRPERPVVVMAKLNVMEDASFQLRRRMAAVWNCSVAEAEALGYSRVQSVAMAVVCIPMEQPNFDDAGPGSYGFALLLSPIGEG